MRVDPAIPEKKIPEVREVLERRLEPGERAVGVFTVVRFRRSVSYLVVTDRRLVTLGLEYQGYPIMDDLAHASVEEVVLERRSAWRFGEVRALDGQGAITYLGNLDTGKAGVTLDLFEDVVEEARSGPGALLPIATPRPPGLPHREWVGVPQDGSHQDGSPQDGSPQDLAPPRPAQPDAASVDAAPAGRYLPLVEQLGELGRLHQEGLLTEEEFAAAKARILHD